LYGTSKFNVVSYLDASNLRLIKNIVGRDLQNSEALKIYSFAMLLNSKKTPKFVTNE